MSVSNVLPGPSAPMPDQSAERPLWPAILRGWRRRCPSCGEGALFDGYVSVRTTCPVCNEELHHHRADDGPAYLTILVVGKVMTVLLYAVFIAYRPDPLIMAGGFTVGSVVLALYLLPRLKGGLIGLQWAKRMHGFGSAPE